MSIGFPIFCCAGRKRRVLLAQRDVVKCCFTCFLRVNTQRITCKCCFEDHVIASQDREALREAWWG